MAGKLIHLDMHRTKELTDLTDPCSICKDKIGCTCERAKIWWNQFAKKFKRQRVIDQLGGE